MQDDLLKIILRLSAEAPNALLVTKRVARDARAAALAVRKLVWQDRILKGTAILKGHASYVMCCAFSPDGTLVVTASNDKTAKLWDAETGAVLLTLEGHASCVRSCAFSPDGKRIVTASHDKTARLWDVKTGALLLTLEGHTYPVMSCAFSPDGTRIVTLINDDTAQVWDAETGALQTSLVGHTFPVLSCTFSPDGKRFVTTSRDKTAQVWDAETGGLLTTLEGHTGVTCCVFSPDGRRLVTASGDKTARFWDAETGALLLTLEGHISFVNSCAFSPDGTRIVTASHDKTARLWDAETGALLLTLEGHTLGVQNCAYSPDGARVLTAGRDETARLWNVDEPPPPLRRAQHRTRRGRPGLWRKKTFLPPDTDDSEDCEAVSPLGAAKAPLGAVKALPGPAPPTHQTQPVENPPRATAADKSRATGADALHVASADAPPATGADAPGATAADAPGTTAAVRRRAGPDAADGDARGVASSASPARFCARDGTASSRAAIATSGSGAAFAASGRGTVAASGRAAVAASGLGTVAASGREGDAIDISDDEDAVDHAIAAVRPPAGGPGSRDALCAARVSRFTGDGPARSDELFREAAAAPPRQGGEPRNGRTVNGDDGPPLEARGFDGGTFDAAAVLVGAMGPVPPFRARPLAWPVHGEEGLRNFYKICVVASFQELGDDFKVQNRGLPAPHVTVLYWVDNDSKAHGTSGVNAALTAEHVATVRRIAAEFNAEYDSFDFCDEPSYRGGPNLDKHGAVARFRYDVCAATNLPFRSTDGAQPLRGHITAQIAPDFKRCDDLKSGLRGETVRRLPLRLEVYAMQRPLAANEMLHHWILHTPNDNVIASAVSRAVIAITPANARSVYHIGERRERRIRDYFASPWYAENAPKAPANEPADAPKRPSSPPAKRRRQ
ncbi:WD40-repeat-containing domain protein [Pelagophyceae sp. CCMP2097]|nr:WD40-repeat-containing domain protein [Pelagophyceae sp. CCMP2097]